MNHLLPRLIAAPFTAFHTDCSLNLSKIENQAEYLIRSGVSGAFICGTTGESTSLTIDERMQLAQRWKEVVQSELSVIVNVSDNCQAHALALAMHSQKIGVCGIGAMSPYFFKPTTSVQLVDFLAPIAAGAPGLPFYYYHIPSMTDVRIQASSFLSEASTHIPTLAGIKFTDYDIDDFKACVNFQEGRYEALFGRDERLLDGIQAGACGAVGSTYNFAAPHYLQIIHEFLAGNIIAASSLQVKAAEFIRVIFDDHGGLAAAKALMGYVGVDCGPVRPPLHTLSSGMLDSLVKALNIIDFNGMQTDIV